MSLLLRVVTLQKSIGRHKSIAYVAFVCLISLHLSLTYSLVVPMMFDYESYANGAVEAPYNTRPLMAWCFQFVTDIGVGDSLRRVSRGMFESPFQVVVLIVSTLALLAVNMFTVKSLRRLYPEASSIAPWASLLSIWMCYAHFTLSPELRYQTPYDILQCAMFAVGLYFIIETKYWLLCCLMVVATLNKESAVFLGVWYAAYNLRASSSRSILVFARCLLLLVLWASIRYVSVNVFEEQSHVSIVGLERNIGFLLNPLHVPTLWSIFGFCWIPLILCFNDVEQPGLRAMLYTFIPWFVVMLFLGDLLEIRIHSEFIPLVTVGFAGVVIKSIEGTGYSRVGSG